VLLRGQRDGDSAEAEVDHRGEGVDVADAEAAALDELDFGVNAFQPGVGKAESDRGDDGVEVFADAADQVGEGIDPATQGGGAPGIEVGSGVVWMDTAVELAQPFFELPGAPELVAVTA
jgi:hypothetical protein